MSQLTFKLEQLVDAWPALSRFASSDPRKEPEGKDAKDTEKAIAANKITAKESYRVGKLLKKVHAEVKDYQEARDKAVKQYGEEKTVKDAQGSDQQFWKVKPENDAVFKKEMDELLAEEITLDGVELIPWAYVEKVLPLPAILSDLFDLVEAPPA